MDTSASDWKTHSRVEKKQVEEVAIERGKRVCEALSSQTRGN